MNVTLTEVTRTPRVSKATGKPFVSLTIKTDQHGDAKLSGFAGADNAHWQVGDSVDIEVEQKGQYLNFKLPRPSARPKDDSRNDNLITFKVIPMLEQILEELKEIRMQGDPDMPVL